VIFLAILILLKNIIVDFIIKLCKKLSEKTKKNIFELEDE